MISTSSRIVFIDSTTGTEVLCFPSRLQAVLVLMENGRIGGDESSYYASEAHEAAVKKIAAHCKTVLAAIASDRRSAAPPSRNRSRRIGGTKNLPAMPTYDKAYFIAKFEAIPDEQWTKGQCLDNKGRRCAIGQCGEDTLHDKIANYGAEARALCLLLPPSEPVLDADMAVTDINDGFGKYAELPTPKARILAALRDLP